MFEEENAEKEKEHEYDIDLKFIAQASWASSGRPFKPDGRSDLSFKLVLFWRSV